MAEPEPEGEIDTSERSGGATNDTEALRDYPSASEIILPALSLNLAILFALLAISCVSQKRWWRKKFGMKPPEAKLSQKLTTTKEISGQVPELLTKEDKEAIDTFLCFFNQPFYLFMISMPAVISLILCPFALYLYEPLVELFWPKKYFPVIPKINDVIACFLTPAGLVYAIAFGFAFQEAQTKQQLMTQSVCRQVSLLVQIVMLTFVVDDLSIGEKQDIFRNLKKEVIDWMRSLIGLVNQDTTDSLHGNLFVAVQTLSSAMKRCGKAASLLPKLSDVLLELDALMSSRIKHSHSSMPLVQWLFLEVLGFFSFFGILLLRADSYRLELTMSILTVFSISAFCYILADLDNPFHGAFCVPMDMLVKFLYHLEQANKEVQIGIPKARRGTKYSIGAKTIEDIALLAQSS